MPYSSVEKIKQAVGGEDALKRYSSFSGAMVDVDAITRAMSMADLDINAACAGRPGFTDAGFSAAIEPIATSLSIGYLFTNVWGDISERRFKLGFETAQKNLQKMSEQMTALVTTVNAAVINASTAYSFGPNDELPDDYGRDSSLKQLKNL